MDDEKPVQPQSELEKRLKQPTRPGVIRSGAPGMITNDGLRPVYPPTIEGGLRLSLNRRRR